MAYQDRLEGELAAFRFQSEDGSYAVGAVKTEEGEQTVVGAIGHLQPGSWLQLEGRWTEHPKFGRRFRVQSFLQDDPRTHRGLERYLAGGAIKGLGAALAQRAVERFGLELLSILDSQPEKLLEVPGIGKKRLEEIEAHWEKEKAGRNLAILLRGHGVGAAVVGRILERYGKDAMRRVTADPYRLTSEIRGVAFRTADAIARSVGIPLDDPRRHDAGVQWILEQAESNGHCFLPHGELAEQLKALGMELDLARLTLQGRVMVESASELHLRPVYRATMLARERFVGADVKARLQQQAVRQDVVQRAERQVGLELAEGQRRAVELALSHRISVITGGPGTGKTTIVRVLIAAAKLRREKWALAAPTGRAARRLSEATGHPGSTLHRLLEYSMQEGGFTRNALKPLERDAVLVDEASMVDLELMEAILKALPTSSRLILVGDADQLPSVGAGRVLGDLINSGVVPVASLDEVYRQAAGSGIVVNANRILNGELPISSQQEPEVRDDFFLIHRSDGGEAVARMALASVSRLAEKGYDVRHEVQVLTPMHRGPAGTQALNEALQARFNPDAASGVRGLRVGDRVIQGRNDYDNEVFNGDVGSVITLGAGQAEVDFDGRRVVLIGEQLDALSLAYAISIHKSQGSEYPAVVVVLDTSHFVMLRRSLLYTAVTRARRFCCVVGHPRAIALAVRQEGGSERYTGLGLRLQS